MTPHPTRPRPPARLPAASRPGRSRQARRAGCRPGCRPGCRAAAARRAAPRRADPTRTPLAWAPIQLLTLDPALRWVAFMTMIPTVLIVMRSADDDALPLALRSLQTTMNTDWGAPMTRSAMATILLPVPFAISSRQLIAGLTAGAVQ